MDPPKGPILRKRMVKRGNGPWILSVIGCVPFLVGLLLVLPLKYKLVSTVLGPWFVDT